MSDPHDLLIATSDPDAPEAAMPEAGDVPQPPSAQEPPPSDADAAAEALEIEYQKVVSAVQRALQMASYLPAEPAAITRVAVVSRQGQLIASAALDSPSQARFVLDQLHRLGFEERRSTEAIQKLGCDLLLVHEANLQVGQVQGIVKGLSGERWPPEG